MVTYPPRRRAGTSANHFNDLFVKLLIKMFVVVFIRLIVFFNGQYASRSCGEFTIRFCVRSFELKKIQWIVQLSQNHTPAPFAESAFFNVFPAACLSDRRIYSGAKVEKKYKYSFTRRCFPGRLLSLCCVGWFNEEVLRVVYVQIAGCRKNHRRFAPGQNYSLICIFVE